MHPGPSLGTPGGLEQPERLCGCGVCVLVRISIDKGRDVLTQRIYIDGWCEVRRLNYYRASANWRWWNKRHEWLGGKIRVEPRSMVYEPFFLLNSDHRGGDGQNMSTLFRRSSNISCFFCQELIDPLPRDPRSFRCPHCTCWNRYNAKGEIMSDEPAMHDEALNLRSFAKRGSSFVLCPLSL